MSGTERIPVLEQLRDLEGWAEYISEVLHQDQRLTAVDARVLRHLGELSWSLRDKLHVVNVGLEHVR